MARPLAVIVLAAGLGTRTKVSLPKVLLPLCGRTLLATVLDTVAELEPVRTVVVLHHAKARIEATLEGRPGLETVDQGDPRGTGHAVQVAMAQLGDFDGDVLIVYGDVPLITAETLRELRDARAQTGAAASILTSFPDEPFGLGRILRDDHGGLVGIREQRDCSPAEREIEEINVGFYSFDAASLRSVLSRLGDDNDQGELYLTDTIGTLIGDGAEVATWILDDPDEGTGINDLAQLAVATELMRGRILFDHLANGVRIEDPATTFIDHGVRIGRDTRILPCTVIRTGVVIGEDCEVGPFTHLRAGTVLADGVELGNFVEAKKAVVGAGAKAKHLTYLGDATIGARANIGCGTITANYDGASKHQTVVGEHAFVGSGTVLVAPAEMGANSMTGAGAIVKPGTRIGDDEIWVGVPARKLDRKREPRGGGAR